LNATGTAYKRVEETFGRVYQQLREDDGGNAPNSYTWFAPTREQLADSVGLGEDTTEAILEGREDGVVGSTGDPTVAWAYECQGDNLYRITESASEDELVAFFGRCMGYDL
jgi:hypothetical protein